MGVSVGVRQVGDVNKFTVRLGGQEVSKSALYSIALGALEVETGKVWRGQLHTYDNDSSVQYIESVDYPEKNTVVITPRRDK